MNINQTIEGNNNSPEINIFKAPLTVDLLPNEINELLDFLSDEENYVDENFGFDIPDLKLKNEKNGIDENYYNFMKADFSYFQDIADILRNDSDNTIKRKYSRATRLLQQQYLSLFQEKMKEFITCIITKYSKDTECSSDVSLKLAKLLHYMYSNCDIGIKPWLLINILIQLKTHI